MCAYQGDKNIPNHASPYLCLASKRTAEDTLPHAIKADNKKRNSKIVLLTNTSSSFFSFPVNAQTMAKYANTMNMVC